MSMNQVKLSNNRSFLVLSSSSNPIFPSFLQHVICGHLTSMWKAYKQKQFRLQKCESETTMKDHTYVCLFFSQYCSFCYSPILCLLRNLFLEDESLQFKDDAARLCGLQRRSTNMKRICNSRSKSIDDLRTLLKI
jgi:hypothetical protein